MYQGHFDIPSPKRKSLGLKPGLRDDRPARTALIFMYELSTKARGKLFIFGSADRVFQMMILPVVEDTTKCRYFAITVKLATLKKLKHLDYGFLECDAV
jgi:hypothetical protein